MFYLCSVVVLIQGIGALGGTSQTTQDIYTLRDRELQKEFYKKDSNWNIITQTRKGIDLEQMDAFERFGAVKLIF
jgi:hypothetical protein